MTITINATGTERKRLVKTISEWLGEDAHYCGAPTFAYEIGRFTVEKNGSLTFSDLIDNAVVERLLEHLYDEGFDIDQRRRQLPRETLTASPFSFPHRSSPKQALRTSKPLSQPKATSSRKPSRLTNSPS